MEQLEVTMKEKQESSVVRQRHAAKTLSVDLASQEVSKEVALEMVRLMKTRVEFFEFPFHMLPIFQIKLGNSRLPHFVQ